MATENASSGIISDLDTAPVPTRHTPFDDGGRVREIVGVLTLTAAQAGGDAGSVWRLAHVPTSARITSIILDSDALAASGLDVDLGFYETTANGGGLVSGAAGTGSDIAIGDSVGPLTSAVVAQEVFDPAAADADKAVWQLAGASADPQREYDVCLTVVTKGTTPAAGSVAVRVRYIHGA